MTREIVLRHHGFLLRIVRECCTRAIVSYSGLNAWATYNNVEATLGLT